MPNLKKQPGLASATTHFMCSIIKNSSIQQQPILITHSHNYPYKATLFIIWLFPDPVAGVQYKYLNISRPCLAYAGLRNRIGGVRTRKSINIKLTGLHIHQVMDLGAATTYRTTAGGSGLQGWSGQGSGQGWSKLQRPETLKNKPGFISSRILFVAICCKRDIRFS